MAQVPFAQTLAVLVQVDPVQQAWPVPPQAWHLPAEEQTAPEAQVVPQHACPTAPHALQVLSLPQAKPVLQSVPPQHACPLPPQAVLLQADGAQQMNPAAQVEPEQQAELPPPQLPHAPFMQVSLVAAQGVLPAQQGSSVARRRRRTC